MRVLNGSKFPNNFFKIPREEAKVDNDKPFEWSKSVLSGKSKVKIVKSKNPKV